MTTATRTPGRYGWVKDAPDSRDHPRIVAPEELASVPVSVDLSTDPNMPPVYDQQQIGSCTANAIAAAFEYDLRRQGLTDFMPSRLFIYYNERAMEGTVDSDSGAQIRDGIKSIAQQGLVPESEWPYDGAPANSDGSWPAGHLAAKRPPAALYAEAAGDEAVQYLAVTQQADQIKAVLAAGDPVVFGFTVYASFESDAVAQSGDAPMPAPGEQEVGGHCVVCVGYDDARGVWICRNSWGTGWGKGGYFTLPYAYLTDGNLASDFWTVKQVTVAQPSPSPVPPQPGPAPQPPTPSHDPADLALVATLGPWSREHHIGKNEVAARAFIAWRETKGL
jgi:C1A family cysteine protease